MRIRPLGTVLALALFVPLTSALAQAADPVSDLEGSADYKRHLITVFLRRAFVKVLSA